ncbi:hypothetical protein F4859DRAFT_518519 [Xylaria cf. heliscus]|nr:hypothetical protein F4859DRAFT_518519 [Xylaria cf. heliscus]
MASRANSPHESASIGPAQNRGRGRPPKFQSCTSIRHADKSDEGNLGYEYEAVESAGLTKGWYSTRDIPANLLHKFWISKTRAGGYTKMTKLVCGHMEIGPGVCGAAGCPMTWNGVKEPHAEGSGPTDQFNNQPADQFNNQPADQFNNQPADQSNNQPADQSNNQPADQSNKPPADQSNNQPTAPSVRKTVVTFVLGLAVAALFAVAAAVRVVVVVREVPWSWSLECFFHALRLFYSLLVNRS